jgi:phosphoribosyl-ATP pyrophosphohydrolase
MKQVSPTDHANARRSRRMRIGNAFSPCAGNGASEGMHAPVAGVASDRRRPATASRTGEASAGVLEDLSRALGHVTAGDHPRTFKLLQSSQRKLARKLIEEACEVTVEAVKGDPDGVVRESADLLYHLIVLWFHIGIEPIEIWEEMQTRADILGIAEKLPKTAVCETAAD